MHVLDLHIFQRLLLTERTGFCVNMTKLEVTAKHDNAHNKKCYDAIYSCTPDLNLKYV